MKLLTKNEGLAKVEPILNSVGVELLKLDLPEDPLKPEPPPVRPPPVPEPDPTPAPDNAA